MSAAKQTFLRLNERGILSLAHKIETDDGSHTIINFTMMPDEPTEEALDGAVSASKPATNARGTRAKRLQQPKRARSDDESSMDVPPTDLTSFAAMRSSRAGHSAVTSIDELAIGYLSQMDEDYDAEH